MKNNPIIFIFVIAFLVLVSHVGCTTSSKLPSANGTYLTKEEYRKLGTWDQEKLKRVLGLPEDPYLTPIPEAPAEYRRAFDMLEAQQFEASAAEFKKMLRDQPMTNWTQAALFNRARALEGLGRYHEALLIYRDVTQLSKRVLRLQALAFLRMGVVYENIGEDDKSLAALKDAERRSSALPPEVSQTELPARLASAYARVKNVAEANRYYQLAESRLAALRARIPVGEQPEWLPRVLFSMGYRPAEEVEPDRFESAIVSFEQAQGYLLQSAELGILPWAQLAADDLISVYTSLRKSIDVVPSPAPSEMMIAAKEQQKARWHKLVRLSDALASLRSKFINEVIASVSADSPLKKIVDFAESFDENIQSALMFDRPVGEQETPESSERKSISPKAVNAVPAFPSEKEADPNE